MRKFYLDNIRWMTVVLVVIYHVIYMYNGILTEGVIGPFSEFQPQDILQYLLYPWFMVLLFIVSGMCSRYYLERHTVKEYVKSRTRKLLVPGTIGILVFGWVQGWVNMQIANAFETLPDNMPKVILYLIMSVSGTGVLWFVQVLWILSMLLALVRQIEKGKIFARTEQAKIAVLVLLGILVWLSGFVLNTPVIAVYRFGIYGMAFFLGYFVFAHDTVINRLSASAGWLLIAAVIAGGVYVFLDHGKPYAAMPEVNHFPAITYAWLCILAILGGARRWADRTGAFSRYMTKRSFGLYVFHYLTLSGVALFLQRSGFEVPLLNYIFITIAAFAGGIGLYEFISRIPFLRWSILGIRTEKKHV